MQGDLSKYRRFIGREYEPPHGCLRLAEQVYREVYGIEVDHVDRGVAANNSYSLYRLLDGLTKWVHPDYVEEGDLILVRSRPWHIGVVVHPESCAMLHSYSGGAACIEHYNGSFWVNRVAGFYRFTGYE